MPTTTVVPAAPPAVSTRATAHGARSTTARFIASGPPRTGPRSPAVPNVSGLAKRAANSVGGQARSSAAVTGSGSWAIQSAGFTAR